MKTFSQLVAEAKKSPFENETAKKEHFMHHAREFHKLATTAETHEEEERMNGHLHNIEKYHGRKIGDEIHHVEDDDRERSHAYDNYAK